jgi:hypothetical protein
MRPHAKAGKRARSLACEPNHAVISALSMVVGGASLGLPEFVLPLTAELWTCTN